MPIKEESFRIGCGRYIQGKDYILKLCEEVSRLGKAPLVIGGKTALEKTREKIKSSLDGCCDKYEISTHTGTCNSNAAKEYADLCKENGYDVIVGVGGGVICDFAKLVANTALLPVITVPTSSATCACFTPLSVCYTEEGRTVGTSHFKNEVNCVIADTSVIGYQPARLLLAGVFDALAKFVEIGHRYNESTADYPMGLDYAYFLSQRSYKVLTEKTAKCLEDMEKGEVSRDVEEVIFACLAATGVISGIARGSNQTALAHKFYEATRRMYPVEAKPYLHGEIVGVGLLLQNHFNGNEKDNASVVSLMKKHGMPTGVSGIGVPKNDASFEEYYKQICLSSAIDENNAEECAKFRTSLEYLWNCD